MDARRRLAVFASHLRPVAASSGAGKYSVSSNCCVSDSKNDENDCVFCRIISGESPAFKLYEDENCLCILDTSPLILGHSLVIPKSHYPSLEETPPSVISAMCSKVPLIGSAIMKATGSDSFNLLVNNGAAAGQVVFHTHLHVIPRKANDGLWTNETIPRSTLKVDCTVYQLVNSVREQLSNIADAGKGQESGLP